MGNTKLTMNKLRVLIIDDDESLNNVVTSWMKGQKVKLAQGLLTGGAAWNELKRIKYDMVVLDWKLPGAFSGLALFNRLRSDKSYRNVPVVVISGFLQQKDFSILDEFPNTHKLKKPFEQEQFLLAIERALHEFTWQKDQEDNLKILLQDVKIDPAQLTAHLEIISDQSPNPFPSFITLGRLLKEMDMRDLAERVFLQAAHLNSNSAMVYNEIGKIYLENGDIKQAKSYLLKAKELSPENFDRLCDLGSISLQEMDIPLARTYFGTATLLDGENKKAISGSQLVENISEWMHEAKSIPSSFASLLNGIGISMVHNKKMEEGIKHYKSALKYVHHPTIKAKLSFNLGLGFLKWAKKKDALSWFEKAVEFDSNYLRPQQYIETISQDASIVAEKKAALGLDDIEDSISDSIVDHPQADESDNITDDIARMMNDSLSSFEEKVNLGFDELYSPVEEKAKVPQNTTPQEQRPFSLYTFIERKLIECEWRQVNSQSLQALCFTDVGINTKLIYVTEDRGYDLKIDSIVEREANGKKAYLIDLVPEDRKIDLRKIVKIS